jgi:cell division protein ZapD
VPKTIVYEQPLNERIRAFLRLEKLFQQYAWHAKQGNEWTNPIALNAIIEIVALTSRSDVKLEVHKELERQHSKLESLTKRPQVDHSQLDSILKNLKERIGEIQKIGSQIGKELQSVDMLNAVKQKNSLPGGICDFDLPAFKHWLHRDTVLQQKHLDQWFTPFKDLDRAVQLILDVIRHSAEQTDETASNGFYQQSLDTNTVIQLLRITLPCDAVYYPEISAGKHRFSVRFMMNDDPAMRPEQCKKDVSFRLQMCSI